MGCEEREGKVLEVGQEVKRKGSDYSNGNLVFLFCLQMDVFLIL